MTLLEVWRNDRYLCHRLLRVLSRDTDIARTRSPIQSQVIRLATQISGFGVHFFDFWCGFLTRDLKRVCPGFQGRTFFFFFFSLIFRLNYCQKFQPNRHNSPPTKTQKKGRLHVQVSPHEVPARNSPNWITKRHLTITLLGWTSSYLLLPAIYRRVKLSIDTWFFDQ